MGFGHYLLLLRLRSLHFLLMLYFYNIFINFFLDFDVWFLGLRERLRKVPKHSCILFKLLHGEGAILFVFLDDEAGGGKL